MSRSTGPRSTGPRSKNARDATDAAPGTATGLTPDSARPTSSPWRALWALVIGFFMILVDSTIVSVATPAIIADLRTGITEVVWVTSAYLLAYAVPLLITGRLGDRVGPKRVYLAGLVVFTLASAACGLAPSVELLIAARAVQGLGAALMTPQTLAVITRTFPPQRRGTAMSLWGSTAGLALLVGPLLGGLLVGAAGWEWIFFVNIPIGMIGFVAAWRLVPSLPTHRHRFDLLGVLLGAAAMFLIVFGIQEGETYHWGRITGVLTVWRLIIAGLMVFAVLLWWQRRNSGEPLIPLGLFRDRNFSLASLGVAAMGFIVTGMGFPLMLYAQVARGLSPTEAALLLAPMAVLAGSLAPLSGRLIDKVNPKWFGATGFSLLALSLVGYHQFMKPEYSTLMLLIPGALLGIASAGIWGPLSVSATRNLPLQHAGAGAGVYNTTRQVGAVIGSAAIAALMEARLRAELPILAGSPTSMAAGDGQLPGSLQAGFSHAMGQSLLLPAAVCLVGVLATLAFAPPKHQAGSPRAARAPESATATATAQP